MAGTALAALRHLDLAEGACDAAVTRAEWPARMQRLAHGPLIDAAPDAELYLDGGHNPAAGTVLADLLDSLPTRPTHLICGMLNTKDVSGYLRPLAEKALSLTAVSIPGEANTLSADETARAATGRWPIGNNGRRRGRCSAKDHCPYAPRARPDLRITLSGGQGSSGKRLTAPIDH